MWLSSRNQFIRSGFKHAGQNKEGEEYEEKRYLCANESWIDGMEWTDGVELGARDSVCLNAWRCSVPGSMVSYNGVAQFSLLTVKLPY
jgi:hypothetical protein